jgi:hypothetical protein
MDWPDKIQKLAQRKAPSAAGTDHRPAMKLRINLFHFYKILKLLLIKYYNKHDRLKNKLELTSDALFYTFHAMSNFRCIWKHEVRQAGQIVKILLDDKKAALSWKIILLPVFLYHAFRYQKNLRFTRKNFLFTKKLALDAAMNQFRGKEPTWEVRRIEMKINEILIRDKRGIYTEKIQHTQLSEIELLIDHYLQLLRTDRTRYAQALKAAYQSKGKYLNFLNRLHKAETGVIQASIETMRAGTKKDRRQWFQKLNQTTRKIRLAEADEIYPKN